MMRGTSNRRLRLDRLLRMVLVVATLFAAWHVASHDVDLAGNTNGHDECQVCRLNHVPVAKSAALVNLAPILLLGLLSVIPVLQPPTQLHRRTLGARAPPLF